MVSRATASQWLSLALIGVAFIPSGAVEAAPVPSVKQYEADALRRFRAQKAQAEASQRAEEARRQAAERAHTASARQQRLDAERAQRRTEEEQTRAQNGRLCEEAVSREAWVYALAHCKAAAASGDVNALYRVGQLVANGYGLPQDPETGFAILLRAARLGSDDAHFSLCGMMRHGFGTTASASNAVSCYMSLIRSETPRRDAAESELRDIYLQGEASPPAPSVPAQLSHNDFEVTLRQLVARETPRVGWGLDVNARVNVLIGRTGRIEGCSVVASDNKPLNELACQAATNALLFKPALDATSQPVMSLYSLPFHVQTVTKACAQFSRNSSDLLGGLMAALACK